MYMVGEFKQIQNQGLKDTQESKKSKAGIIFFKTIPAVYI